MKKYISLKNMFFCFMMIFVMAFNTVNVQAGALDYLGNTIDGSVLTNENGSSRKHIKALLEVNICYEGFVRITNNGNGYIGIFGGTALCNVTCNTVKLNIYLERSSGDQKTFIAIKSGKMWIIILTSLYT